MTVSTSNLENLREALLDANTREEKLIILNQQPQVQLFKESNPDLSEWLDSLTTEQRYLLIQVIAVNQGASVFEGLKLESITGFDTFLKILRDMDRFYDTIGGIVGYQLTVLRLLGDRHVKGEIPEGTRFLKPEGMDLEAETAEVRRAIRFGLEHLPQLAEIYPVGGAGDRLALVCKVEQEPLPAAQLLLLGRTLLEGLLRDLQAREYLYYKLYGKQVTIPIALMTSHEKRNHYRIMRVLEENDWFERPQESIRLFTQPLVPIVSENGDWIMNKALHPKLKPGGHGALWKLAMDHGIFDWLEQQQKVKGLVRQINNPVASTDYGLLAFTGVGFAGDKDFGFASCPRLPNTAEGTDVLIEEKTESGFRYALSNIEYTDFLHQGIEDKPISDDTPYSQYPSNTNILFFDLKAIREAEKKCPIPGMLINMKNIVRCGDKDIHTGRLESTMQNISDVIDDVSSEPLKTFDGMRAYITFNKRRKTLSVAKNAYSPEKPLIGTPQGCLYEMLENIQELLTHHCKIQTPNLGDAKAYLEEGPGFFVLFHPALGPIFSIIGQKIQGGVIAPNSDMILEIAELEMKEVDLDGSLLIKADHPLGKEEKGILRYGNACGKCTLKNVIIENRGIDRTAKNNVFWKNQLTRKEALEIRLQGNAEFVAENVSFKGNHHLVIPDGHRMVAYEEGGELKFHMDPIKETWGWNYSFDNQDRIVLHKKNLNL